MQTLKQSFILSAFFSAILLAPSCSKESLEHSFGEPFTIQGISPAGTWNSTTVLEKDKDDKGTRTQILVFAKDSGKVIQTVIKAAVIADKEEDNQPEKRTLSEYACKVLGTETVNGNLYTVLQVHLVNALIHMPILIPYYGYIRIDGDQLITTNFDSLSRKAAREAVQNGHTVSYEK